MVVVVMTAMVVVEVFIVTIKMMAKVMILVAKVGVTMMVVMMKAADYGTDGGSGDCGRM